MKFRIREQRRRAGLTQTALGSRLSPAVTHATIQRWEAGTRQPSAAQLTRVAAALNCEITDLLPPKANASVVLAAHDGLPATAVSTVAGRLYERLLTANIKTDAATFGALVTGLARDVRLLQDGSVDQPDLDRLIRIVLTARKSG